MKFRCILVSFLLVCLTVAVDIPDVFVSSYRSDCGFRNGEEQSCEACTSKGTVRYSLFEISVDIPDVFVSSYRSDCGFRNGEEQSCEACTSKGTDCFWCGGSTKRCMSYEWYFPGCPLDDVRHKNCWVNLSALIIVVSIICGIILVILIACLCYCCCRYKDYRRTQAKKKGLKYQQKEDKKAMELKAKADSRSEQREKELEPYRIKYGIPKKEKSTPTGSVSSYKKF